MKKALVSWLAGVLAVLATVWLAKQLGILLYWPEKWKILIFIPILAIVNAVLGSAMRILTVPLTCLTFGLFHFVVNAIVFYTAGVLTNAKMNFWSAVFGSICVSVLSGIANWMLGNSKEA